MGVKQIINYEKALEEKKAMQEVFFRDHGYPSSVLTLVITWLEERNEKK